MELQLFYGGQSQQVWTRGGGPRQQGAVPCGRPKGFPGRTSVPPAFIRLCARGAAPPPGTKNAN
jgi:hypothetical protein